jgi:Flp pilus assembly protein TadG
MKNLKRLLRRFWCREDGAAAVEFALVALPFFWILFVIFETATVIFTDIAIQNAVTETARLIRTGQAQTQGIKDAGAFKLAMCENLASYLDCSKIHVDVRKSASLPITAPNLMEAEEGAAEAFQVSGPMEWVMVQAYYDWQLAAPGVSGLANIGEDKRRLVGGALFRNEPYGG